jgi:hypothetical protein
MSRKTYTDEEINANIDRAIHSITTGRLFDMRDFFEETEKGLCPMCIAGHVIAANTDILDMRCRGYRSPADVAAEMIGLTYGKAYKMFGARMNVDRAMAIAELEALKRPVPAQINLSEVNVTVPNTVDKKVGNPEPV